MFPFGIGNVPELFFSSVVPASATRVPVAWCAGVVTVENGFPVGGLSNSPNRNISVSIRCTIVFSTDREIVPLLTASKSGVPAADVERLIEETRTTVEILGLMTIPPPASDPERSRSHFVALRATRDRLAAATGLALSELSMGMTDDFEVAIEEGATIVRVGRAIFGERRGSVR